VERKRNTLEINIFDIKNVGQGRNFAKIIEKNALSFLGGKRAQNPKFGVVFSLFRSLKGKSYLFER